MKRLRCCEHSKVVTVLEVSLELSVSVQAVHQFLKRHGVRPCSRKRAYHANLYWSLDVYQAYGCWRPLRKWSP